MEDESTPRDPLAARADALEKARAELEAEKQAAAALAAENAPQIERNRALDNWVAGLPQSDRRKVLDATGQKRVSSALRPIEPLRASGPLTLAKREDAPRKPIAWKLWATVPEVALWEAVALLLAIEPGSLQPLRYGWMAGPGREPFFEPRSFPNDAKREGFESALSFAERAAKVAGPIYLRTGLAVGMNKRTAQVSLAEVVAFFVSCEWPDIPAPLLALVPAAACSPASKPAGLAPADEVPSIAPVSKATTPPPLTTPDIADAFDGIDGLTAKQWRDKLGDVKNHQWVLPARAEKVTAPKAATWWPITLAELLLARGASDESLNRVAGVNYLGRPATTILGLYAVSCGTNQSHLGIAEAKGCAGRCLSLDMRR